MANFDLTVIIVSFKGLLPVCLSPEPKTLMLETVFLFHLSNNIMPSFTLGIGFLPCPNFIFFFTLKTLDYLILALIFSSPLYSCFSLLPFPLFTSLLLSMEDIWDYLFFGLADVSTECRSSLSSLNPSHNNLLYWSLASCSHLCQNEMNILLDVTLHSFYIKKSDDKVWITENHLWYSLVFEVLYHFLFPPQTL